MFRKTLIAGAIMVGLLGSASTAWAGDDPVPYKADAPDSVYTEVLSTIDPSVDERLIFFCGHGYFGWINFHNDGQVTGSYWGVSTPECQGDYHVI